MIGIAERGITRNVRLPVAEGLSFRSLHQASRCRRAWGSSSVKAIEEVEQFTQLRERAPRLPIEEKPGLSEELATLRRHCKGACTGD